MNPTELNGKQRRQQILDEACKMFSEKGIQGSSMRALADACNCNEALLYKHFPNKEALFREVIEKIQTTIRHHWMEVSRTAPTGLDALRRIIKSIHNGTFGDLHMYANMVHCMAALMRNPEMKPLLAADLTHQVEMFTDLVHRGVKDGSIVWKADPAQCAWCVFVRSFALSAMDSLLPDESDMIPRHGDPAESVLSCLTGPAVPASDETCVKPDW